MIGKITAKAVDQDRASDVYIVAKDFSWTYVRTHEEEIPLAVQIITSNNQIMSYQVDYFHSPEEYEKLGYEGVFAITIRFSQKTVGELDIQ